MPHPVWTKGASRRSICPCESGRVPPRHPFTRRPFIREDMMTSKRRGQAPAYEPAAGNGLIDRRALLGRGAMIAGAMGVAGSTGAAAESLTDPQWSLAFGEI